MNKQKISKQKALFISMSIVTAALLIGVLGILFMPEIKGWFHKDSSSYSAPTEDTFTENDKNIEINVDDTFEIRFSVSESDIKADKGWAMLRLSNFNQGAVTLLEGSYKSDYQVWGFYGMRKGEIVLSFQKGSLTKEFLVKVN